MYVNRKAKGSLNLSISAVGVLGVGKILTSEGTETGDTSTPERH